MCASSDTNSHSYRSNARIVITHDYHLFKRFLIAIGLGWNSTNLLRICQNIIKM